MQPVTWGVSGLWHCWVCKWFSSQFRAFWVVLFNLKHTLYSHSQIRYCVFTACSVLSHPDWDHRSHSFKSPNCCHSDMGGPDCRDSPQSVHILWAAWHLRWRATPGTVLVRGKLSNVSHCTTARIKFSYFLLCSFFLIFWFSPLCLSSCLCCIFFLSLFPSSPSFFLSFPVFISSSFYLIFSPSH